MTEIEIKKIAANILNVSEFKIEGLKRFKKGMSNYTYYFKVDNDEYVIRFLGVDANKFVDRINELNALAVLESNNLTTELIYFDIESGIRVSKYAKGNEFNFNENNIEDLIKALKTLHGIETLDVQAYDVVKRINTYESYLEGLMSLDEKYYVLKTWFINQYNDNYSKNPQVLCHNDLQTSNIIIDGNNTIKFIDLEFAGMNDIYYDFATFEEKAYYVYEQYFATKIDIKAMNHIDLYKIFQQLQWYLVALYKEKIGFSKLTNYDFQALAKYFINTAIELYNDYVKRG